MTNRKILFLWIALALPSCCDASGPNEGTNSLEILGVRTEFDPDYVLSTNEVGAVLKLASLCGVTNVAKIYTYNIHPSPAYGVGILGPEAIQGREIRGVDLFVNDERWTKPRLGHEVSLSNGKFWVGAADIQTNIYTTFTFSGRSTRIMLFESISLATADKIFEAFGTGKIKYQDEKSKEDLKNLSLMQVTGLSLEKDGVYCISFSPEPLSLAFVRCILESSGITVVDVGRGAM